MILGEKLKEYRKGRKISQEDLAEKLNVSRQAITKWETGAGVPDIENIVAIAKLMGVSVDELISGEKDNRGQRNFSFESNTEYDIDEIKRCDMKLGGAKKLVIYGYDGEKIGVRLASDSVETVQSDFKVKIDDTRKRIDVDVSRKNDMTEAKAKEEITIFVKLPNPYTKKIEIAANAEIVEIADLECDSIELDVKTREMNLSNIVGTVEINCNLDMNITCDSLNGAVEINQVSATSKIWIPGDISFAAIARGVGTNIYYECDGNTCDSFCNPDSENLIELNGIKSELVICTSGQEAK